MKKRWIRLCSLILVIVMVANSLPLNVWAEQSQSSKTAATSNVSKPESESTVKPAKAQVMQELADKRTEYTKEFLLENGFTYAVVYGSAVHYEEGGQWKEIDNTLKTKIDGTITNTAGVWDVAFPQQISGNKSISVTKDGYTLSFGMAGELRQQSNLEVMSVGEKNTDSPSNSSEQSIVSVETADNQKAIAENIPEVTISETTAPETIVPETTVPEVSVSEITVPETTVSETTVPETIFPETTIPETTVSETTDLESTVPEETEPETNTHIVSAPVEAVPAETIIAEPTASVLVDGKLQTFAVSSARNVSGKIQPINLKEALDEAEYEEIVLTKSVSQLLYSDVYNNTDIQYDLVGNQVKESIILESYNKNLRGYQFALNTGKLIPVLAEDGHIDFFDEEKKNIIMIMPAPYLEDSKMDHSDDVRVFLTGKDGMYTLTYLLPQAWLAAEGRAWPVILDPVVIADSTIWNIEDQTVMKNKEYSHNWGAMQVGQSATSGISRPYVKFVSLPPLNSSDVIVSATVRMYNPNSGKKEIPVTVHKVNNTWKASTLQWDNMPGFQEEAEDYANVAGSGWYYWDITDIARDWYTNKNTGMMFKATDADEAVGPGHYKQFYSSDWGTSRYLPHLAIIYRNNNGLESYWDYTSSSAGRAGTGYVNQYTGNLVWIYDDIGFGGNRMPVSISHIYNSNDSTVTRFGMGAGWRINYNQRIYQWSQNSLYYVWEDGDGTDHYFLYSKANTYKDEDGMEMTLTTGGSGNTTYKLKDKNGNISYFDANGRLRKIQNNQKIKSSITFTYTTTTSHRIKTITDGAGRKYTFSYTDQLLRRISYTGLPEEDGTTGIELAYTTYSYDTADKPNLTGITWQDGKNAQYTYVDGTNLLSGAEDIDNYKLVYEYDDTVSGKPNRIVKISEFDGSVSGGVLNFTYDYNQTTITDQTDGNDQSFNTQILQFNNMGNTVSIQDGEGHAQYAMYAKNNAEDDGKGNQLKASSKLQNTVGNLLPNHSFEFTENNTELYGWTVSGTATVSTDAYLGGKSMSLSSGSAASGEFAVSAGESISFSAYVKTNGSNSYLELQSGSTTLASQKITDATQWARVEVNYNNTGAGSQTVKAVLRGGSGETVLMDCAQLERCPSASRYNLVTNGDFSRTAGTPAVLTQWTVDESTTVSDVYAVTNVSNKAAPQLDSSVLSVPGNPKVEKGISQTLPISGDAGDCFIVSGWARGNSAAIDNHDDRGRTFALQVSFNYTEDIPEEEAEEATKSFDANFNPQSQYWQYSSSPAVAKYAYDSVTVRVAYDYNINEAQFDGIQLYKEEFSQSYTYDEETGNLISVTDLQKKNTTYEYDEDNNLIKEVLPNGATMEYTYDDWHNVETAKTATGLVYTFTYDDYGNNTKVSITNEGITITSSAEYSDDYNRLEKAIDATGKETEYHYNADTNVLEWVKYPEDTPDTNENTQDGTVTRYTYDSMYRMATAAATTDSGLTLSASYTYTDDLLTKIQTPTTEYDFTYGNFALRSNIKIGSRTLAEYTYTAQDNYLSSLDYGNDDKVEYEYDSQGRVTKQTYEDGATVEYRYNNDGALATVTDFATGRTTTYYYDFIDRMMKYVESGDSYSHSVGYEYDDINNLTKLVETINGTEYETAYTYDDDNRVTSVSTDNSSKDYTYDSFGRVGTQITKHGDAAVKTDSFTFTEPLLTTTDETITGFTSPQVSSHTITAGSNNKTYNYTYDDNGNILSISDGTNTISYVYDSANQLIRENNEISGKTKVWTYDSAGNIRTRKEYAYTTNAAITAAATDTVSYTYGDSSWGDLLTAYDGVAISHDTIGNPLSDGTWNYTWKHGRQLASMSNGSTTWNFTYNADGIRTSRTNGSTTYNYVYNGDKLSEMTEGSNLLHFTYDASGTPMAVLYNGTTYYYVTNIQGDVIAILNSSGVAVVEYAYDAWGNPVGEISGTMATTLGAINPLRYRGYVYDQEYGFYYLQSRYYDPEVGRFLNADALTSTGQGLLGNNMYAYCQNNPVVFMDSYGYCREVGALLTWIDCENKHCPTSSKYLHGTLTVGIGASVTAFVGVSDSLAFSFDLHGNVEVQRSTSRPDKPETTTIGLISYSVPAYFVQFTNKGDISELTGISTYVGADLPFCGFDVVSDAPAADLNGKICGVQFAVGQGGGVDVHIAQTNTETIARFNWREIGKWAKNFFV